MKAPIITIYLHSVDDMSLVAFLRRLRDEGFNPFISIGEPRVYSESLIIQSDGQVYISSQANSETVATIRWEPVLEEGEMKYAQWYYQSYYSGTIPDVLGEYKYMLGNGYFSPPPLARPIDFQELLEQMAPKRDKRKVEE